MRKKRINQKRRKVMREREQEMGWKEEYTTEMFYQNKYNFFNLKEKQNDRHNKHRNSG